MSKIWFYVGVLIDIYLLINEIVYLIMCYGHFYFKWKWKSLSLVQLFGDPMGLYSPRNSLGQNTGMGNLSLLQGIFPTQGLKPGMPHCRWILYQLSHKGSPRILQWVACPFSKRSSQPRNRTGVSCIAGRFFTNWAIREAHFYLMSVYVLFIWSD